MELLKDSEKPWMPWGTLEEPWGERKDWWLIRHRAVEVEKIAQ